MNWLSRYLRRHQVPDAENWTVAGSGNLLGRDWSERAGADGSDRQVDVAWLEGFFTGLSLGENFTFLATSNDLLQAIAWMDQRLANWPDERVSQAAAQLAAQLLNPMRSKPW